MADESILNKGVFSLKYIAAVSVSKCQPHFMDVLPNELKLYLHKIQNILKMPSTVKMSISFFKAYNLKTDCEERLLKSYHFEFPNGLDCYAEIMNETFGIKAIAEVEFEDIYIEFSSTCKISLADILQFLSDISGEEISLLDIKITSVDIETQLPSPHGVYNIEHNYNGWISTLNKALKSYKHRQFTCFNHFLETKQPSLMCTNISLDYSTLSDFQ